MGSVWNIYIHVVQAFNFDFKHISLCIMRGGKKSIVFGLVFLHAMQVCNMVKPWGCIVTIYYAILIDNVCLGFLHYSLLILVCFLSIC